MNRAVSVWKRFQLIHHRQFGKFDDLFIIILEILSSSCLPLFWTTSRIVGLSIALMYGLSKRTDKPISRLLD